MLAAGQAIADSPDRVLAIVGKEVVLKSDLDEREIMARMQDPNVRSDPRFMAQLLESMIDQKVILAKAKLDSVAVDERAVDSRADERFRQISARFTSAREMEARYGIPVARLKEEVRTEIRNQQLVETLKRKNLKDVSVSYDEVMDFYRNRKSQLPLVPEGVEVSQIVKYPVVSDEARRSAFEKIEVLQERLKAGADFAAIAREYSDDPGSGALGGDLGFVQKGELVASFEAVAFALKPGQVSEPVETRFGYHLIQVLDKEDGSVHVRHILAAFDRTKTDQAKTLDLLRSVRADIIAGKATFAEMARRYSDDPLSARLGGVIKSSSTGRTVFEPSTLRPDLQNVIAGLKAAGDLSQPEKISSGSNGQPFYALFRLDSRVPAHRMTPEQDFALVEELAIDAKRQQLYNDWVKGLRKEILVRRMSDI